MHYLVFNASPHKGNTWRIAQTIKDNMQRADSEASFEELHLSELNLPFCTGCSICFRKGHALCPHSGVMRNLIEKIERSDGVIYAFTTFNLAQNAMAKNFMDHLCFALHRPRFFRNKVLVVSSVGGVGANKAVKDVAGSWRAMGFSRVYTLAVQTASWNAYQSSEKDEKRYRKLALKFHKDCASGKMGAPRWLPMITYNMFRGMGQHYAPGSEYAYEDGVFWTHPARAKSTWGENIRVPFYKRWWGMLFYAIGKVAGTFITVTYRK